MKLAIMQPYFMPYLGYFSLIKHTDEFILFDTPQFIYHGWIERNRILKPDGGWQYIHVALKKHHRDTSIRYIEVDNSQDWEKKILAQLQHYRKKAPHYYAVIRMLNQLFENHYHDIVSLNLAALTLVCEYLQITRPISVFSKMELNTPPAAAPDEWALNICLARSGATEYWNPPGGQDFFNPEKYAENGIKLRFQEMILDEYPQKGNPFEPGLSIIDVLMFNSVEQTHKLLDHYRLIGD